MIERMCWVGFWTACGVGFLLIAVAVAQWASLVFLLIAGWFFRSAWRAYHTDILIIRDPIGNQVHRSERRH